MWPVKKLNAGVGVRCDDRGQVIDQSAGPRRATHELQKGHLQSTPVESHAGGYPPTSPAPSRAADARCHHDVSTEKDHAEAFIFNDAERDKRTRDQGRMLYDTWQHTCS